MIFPQIVLSWMSLTFSLLGWQLVFRTKRWIFLTQMAIVCNCKSHLLFFCLQKTKHGRTRPLPGKWGPRSAVVVTCACRWSMTCSKCWANELAWNTLGITSAQKPCSMHAREVYHSAEIIKWYNRKVDLPFYKPLESLTYVYIQEIFSYSMHIL